MDATDRVIAELRDARGRERFADLPEIKGQYFAVWVDEEGAREMSRISPEPIPAAIIFVGECPRRSARHHLMHRGIGSFTMLKNLAALFRQAPS